MKLLQFGDNQDAIIDVLAAILHIGNIKFEKDDKLEDAVKISNTSSMLQKLPLSCSPFFNRRTFDSMPALDFVSDLLGLDHEQTKQSFITRQISVVGEATTITPLNNQQAIDGQDALAKGKTSFSLF